MPRIHALKILLLTAIACFGTIAHIHAQTDQIEHEWYDQDTTAKVQIYKAISGKYCGKVTWLKNPTRDGHIKVDINNPDDSKHNDPILGMVILKNMKKINDKVYDDGTIYDPTNGKTYSCKITYDGNRLLLRGYIGFSLIGRSYTFTRAN